MICTKFGWNWPSGSDKEEENVKNYHEDNIDDVQKSSFGSSKVKIK